MIVIQSSARILEIQSGILRAYSKKQPQGNIYKIYFNSQSKITDDKINTNNSTESGNFKPSFFMNSENIKTNFTMKSLNCDLKVSFLKKESGSASLNTVKKNLIPNLNNNNDIECYLGTGKKSSNNSRYNKILSEHKIINNYKISSNINDINEKLEYILNSKKRTGKLHTKLLKRKRKTI